VDDGPGGATPGDLSADEVPVVLARDGRACLQHTFGRVLALAMLGGSFVTFGCLLSVLLSTGVEAEGLALLLARLGFSAGYWRWPEHPPGGNRQRGGRRFAPRRAVLVRLPFELALSARH